MKGLQMENNKTLQTTGDFEHFPVANLFTDHEIYARTIFMPKGSLVVGRLHKTRHLNFVMTGKAWVWMNGKKQYVQAPCIIESFENVRKVLIIEEDMYWTTVHRTDLTDPDEVVDEVTADTSTEDLIKELKEQFKHEEVLLCL